MTCPKAALLTGPVLVSLASLFAFGGSSEHKSAPLVASPPAAPGEPVAFFHQDPATAATIKGKVAFNGDAPKMAAIDLSADSYCTKKHAEEKVVKEEVVVNGNGTLRNVLVYAKSSSKAIADKKFEAPKTSVLLDQTGCMYKPHVFGVMAGQPITIRSSDDTNHNIKCQPKKNDSFNFSQPKPGEETKKFDKEEVTPPIRLECNVHPWMNGFCGVFSHPFFAVTGEDGTYTIAGLPPGDYEIVAWQESTKLDGQKTSTVTLGPKETKTLDFAFAPKAKAEKKE
ncbi:MAG TPA: carboxypeptidase regulatory-like domain-containing protein [Planctomycetota bacterium]|jgi:plastocyanin|nr:carboxypeptidase regulatory-like domain-containing protein [Planctomycetota bacterium]